MPTGPASSWYGVKNCASWDTDMRSRRRTYAAFGIGCAVVWLVILAVTSTSTDESKRRTIRLTCAGWWLGWLSTTIARQVYPPPPHGQAPS